MSGTRRGSVSSWIVPLNINATAEKFILLHDIFRYNEYDVSSRVQNFLLQDCGLCSREYDVWNVIASGS
jgi:hypothetical protein